MNGGALGQIETQSELDAQVQGFLKVAGEVDKVVKTQNGRLGFISRGDECKSWEVRVQLYKNKQDYGVYFLSPHFWKDLITLEKMQKRFKCGVSRDGEFQL